MRRGHVMRCERAAPGARAMRSGFTLIEMVVVLLMLGITAGVAIPAFTRFARTDTGTRTTDAVVQLMRSARLAAITRGAAVVLTIDPATARYWATAEPAADGTADSEAVAEGTLALEPGSRLIATRPRVRFTFDPTGTGFGDSLVVQGTGFTSTIALDRWTGDPRVEAP